MLGLSFFVVALAAAAPALAAEVTPDERTWLRQDRRELRGDKRVLRRDRRQALRD